MEKRNRLNPRYRDVTESSPESDCEFLYRPRTRYRYRLLEYPLQVGVCGMVVI